ncbi:MAG: hypothetical protein BA863_01390 [Desulfovibrio sp. S3730MH75]|nr:MAG: hypothetical protein BA863_01390 [Desulfovibrio sp. S3730MH75]
MDNIDNAIAILGTYIALMAVLAVMVEALISWLKIPGNSPLKGKPSPEDVLNEVKVWLKDDDTELYQGKIDALNKALTSVGETVETLTTGSSTSEVAAAAGKATAKYFHNEQMRRGFIRFLAIAFGIVFALTFQIDTLEILSDFTVQTQAFLGSASHFVGIILSGFAASAGSSFWHDQSAKLRSIKNTKESTSELMSKG